MATKVKTFVVVTFGVLGLFALAATGETMSNKRMKSRFAEDERDTPTERPSRSPGSKDRRHYCGTSTRRAKRTDEFRFARSLQEDGPVGSSEDRHHRQRARRDLSAGSAVHFTGRSDALLYKTPSDAGRIPRGAFSVALWVKPAGGQNSPAVIIGLLDTCRSVGNHWTWSLGIDTDQGRSDKDARFYFSVGTDRSRVASSVRAVGRYEPETWTHLAASYDGSRLVLYINGAKEAIGQGVAGPMFSEVMHECKQLVIGGNINDDRGFRGVVDQVTVWSGARPHRELSENQLSGPPPVAHPDVAVRESFDGGEWLNWKAAAENEPTAVASDIAADTHRVAAKVPPCGVTACDSPVVAGSYAGQPELRAHKTVRYRAIVMAEDDGSNPIVDHASVLRKHALVNEAFRPHNISWEVTEFVVRNSSLRQRVVLALCFILDIGNGECNPECRGDVTGDDGGDCAAHGAEETCLPEQIGNGACDGSCNTRLDEYDGGDCCDPSLTDVTVTCFDPRSLYRNYLTLDELKSIIGMESNSHLNVYFVNFADSSIEGIATMPWEMGVHGSSGGTVLQADTCGSDASSETIIHELGHNLGLLHVHQAMECMDECREHTASPILGDLVMDTNPTPENDVCRDPRPCDTDLCFSETDFKDTPYRNYMSYTDSQCTDHFTDQQGSRMHCYLDLVYQSWLQPRQDTAPPVLGAPLNPRVVAEGPRSTGLAWLAPVSRADGGRTGDSACQGCTAGGRLVQYAEAARFHPVMGGYSSPDEATGAPDDLDGTCFPAHNSWMATGHNTLCDTCYLELVFKTAVVPSELILWTTYARDGGVRNLQLQYRDGSVESLGPQPAFCDVPLTLRLAHVTRRVQAIRVYADDQYFSLDAVQLVSVSDWSGCAGCDVLSYKILRDPPFPNGERSKVTQSTAFTDTDVDDGVTYSYRIQAFRGDESSVVTSPLRHRHGQEFCGNGRKERSNSEECDDGNVRDGDGCSVDCKLEDSYICEGEFSICSRATAAEDSAWTGRHPADAHLSDDGFQNQWAVSAQANPLHQTKANPLSTLFGPPPATVECRGVVEDGHGWSPYVMDYDADDFWVRVRFSKPVVATAVIVHLAADGIRNRLSSDPTRLSLELVGPDGAIHGRPWTDRPVTCQDSPVHFNISQDLNAPFVHTQEVVIRFSSYTFAVSAVGLRSRAPLDPVTLASCSHDQLFNPATGQCVSYECAWPECGPLTVPHSVVNCSGRREGDRCTVRCQDGYSTDGMLSEARMLCNQGEWRGPEMICKAVDCGKPSLPYAEVVCQMGTTYGKQCKLKCIPPAKMQGTVQTITCLADGLYSLPEAFCQLQCDIPYVPNAILLSQQCQTGSHNIGTICKYRCDAGYHVLGQSSKRRKPQKLKYKCSEDTTWFGPTCVPVVCDPPPIIFNDLYTCTDGYNYDSQCYRRCDDVSDDVDAELNSVRCVQDTRDASSGVWDGDFRVCASMEGSCDAPQPQSNRNVELRCDDGYAVGSRCTAVCPNIYDLSDNEPALLPSSATSLPFPDFDWTTANHMIICTVQREWFPDPRRITCVEGCFEPGIRNGICQGVNNRAHCNWDGGDCCRSTSGVGGVITTTGLADNDDDALCFDPNAQENRPTNGSNRKNRDRP